MAPLFDCTLSISFSIETRLAFFSFFQGLDDVLQDDYFSIDMALCVSSNI